MKAVWVDEGNDPDYEKLARHGITTPYFALRDERVTVAYLSDVKARGNFAAVGVYAAANWPEYGGDGQSGGDGFEYAALVSERLRSVMGARLRANFPKVQHDHEDHDPDKIADALTRWRALHRYQDTSWTMEGGQAGWMDADFVSLVIDCRVRLVPQLYNGAMTEVWDSLAYTRELTRIGFPDALISPFYDAAHLPVGWDGFAFTMGRLP